VSVPIFQNKNGRTAKPASFYPCGRSCSDVGSSLAAVYGAGTEGEERSGFRRSNSIQIVASDSRNLNDGVSSLRPFQSTFTGIGTKNLWVLMSGVWVPPRDADPGCAVCRRSSPAKDRGLLGTMDAAFSALSEPLSSVRCLKVCGAFSNNTVPDGWKKDSEERCKPQ
jgi:hypothetical protein